MHIRVFYPLKSSIEKCTNYSSFKIVNMLTIIGSDSVFCDGAEQRKFFLYQDYNELYYLHPLFPVFRSLRFLPMRAPRGLAGLTLTLGSAASPAAGSGRSGLALALCLSVVFRFLTGGSSSFLTFATSESSLRRLRSDVLELACCIKHNMRKSQR